MGKFGLEITLFQKMPYATVSYIWIIILLLSLPENHTNAQISYPHKDECDDQGWLPISVYLQSTESPFEQWLKYKWQLTSMQIINSLIGTNGVINFADSCFLDDDLQSGRLIVCINKLDLTPEQRQHDIAFLQVYESLQNIRSSDASPVLIQQFEINDVAIFKTNWFIYDNKYYLYCIGQETHGDTVEIAVFSFTADGRLNICADANIWANYTWVIDDLEGYGPVFVYERCWGLGPDQEEGVIEFIPFSLAEGFARFYSVDLVKLLNPEEIELLDSLDNYKTIVSYALLIRDEWRGYVVEGFDRRSGHQTNLDGSEYPIRFTGGPMWREINLE